MDDKRWIVSAIASFIVGFIIGGYAAWDRANKFLSVIYGEPNRTIHSLDLKKKLATLEYLEQGNSKRAAQMIEIDMLSNLTALTGGDHFRLPEATRKDIRGAIDKAREHFSRYGIANTDPNIEKMLRQALYDNTYLRASVGK